MRNIYWKHRGDAAFKMVVIVGTILIILGAVLFGKASERTGGETGESVISDAAIGKAPIRPGNITPDSYKKNSTRRTTELSGTDDMPQGQVVEGGQDQGQPEKPNAEEFGQHSGLFYYEKLTEAEKEVYCQIYQSMVTRENATLSTTDIDLADRMYQFILWDHPEIFDTNGYQIVKHSIGDKVKSLTMQPKFDMTTEEKNNCQALIDKYAETFMASVPPSLDGYGKVKYVYEYLIGHTEYALDCENSQNICSVFILHKSVCAGYAKATQYLLRKLSVPSAIVHGSVDGQPHAWNLVFIDNIPYYLDTTWGDASYSFADDGQQAGRQPDINYDYFLITEKEIEATHQIENKEYYPVVVATDLNYYRKEGLYFEFFDKDLLARKMGEAYDKGASNLTIRLATDSLLLEMKDTLIENQEIFHYLRNVDRFYYNINESMRTMTFWLY